MTCMTVFKTIGPRIPTTLGTERAGEGRGGGDQRRHVL